MTGGRQRPGPRGSLINWAIVAKGLLLFGSEDRLDPDNGHFGEQDSGGRVDDAVPLLVPLRPFHVESVNVVPHFGPFDVFPVLCKGGQEFVFEVYLVYDLAS